MRIATRGARALTRFLALSISARSAAFGSRFSGFFAGT
jgi:hypothetical protein